MAKLHFPVEAYNDEHKLKLMASRRSARIKGLLEKGLFTTDSAILIHAMFTEQDSNVEGYRSYSELANMAASREATLRSYISLEEGAIGSVRAQNSVHKLETERVGVACAILVMNEVLDVTEADWTRIPDGNTKSLDFKHIVSDGSAIVAVEAKGTVAEEPHKKGSGSTSAMKADIELKKKENPTAADESFGVITAIGQSPAVQPMIFLLDPPAQGSARDPRKERLLARLNYYLDHLALVSQFRMLIALKSRVDALGAVTRYDELDEIGLTNFDGKLFSPPSPGGRPMLLWHGLLVRLVMPKGVEKNDLPETMPAIGFAEELFDLLVEQRFSSILSWRQNSTQQETSGQAVFSIQVRPGKRAINLSGYMRLGINRAGIAYGSFSPDAEGLQNWKTQ